MTFPYVLRVLCGRSDQNPMSRPNDPRNHADARRQRARRTALWVAAVAVAVYAGFILMAVLAQ